MKSGIILMKDPVAIESLISIFQCNEKHFFDTNSVIDCSFIQNHQRCYTLGTGTQLDHYFRWKFSSLPNAILFIGISKTDCPHSVILKVIDIANVRKLLILKENLHGCFLSRVCSNPNEKFFPLDLLTIINQ